MGKKKEKKFENPAGIRKYEPGPYTRWIVSKRWHNMSISYNGQTLNVPPNAPKGKVRVDDYRKLSSLPKGLFLVNY